MREDQEQRIADIYEELAEIHVELDPDPLEYGPERITLKFADIDKHSQRMTQIELQLVQDIHTFKKSLAEERVVYDAKKFKLMATDPRIKAEKSRPEREAAAIRFLEEDTTKVRNMENFIADLEIVLLNPD